ncbi:MAG TPA: hypothetical protein VJP05_00590 [Acidimicrobiia bacterium]|nr:hypothetical protein [Acidimicrobiia bacterium]
MSRRTVGLIGAAVGAALVLVSSTADLIGISSGGSAEMFGRRQIVGTVVGAVMLVAGLVVALLAWRAAASKARSAAKTGAGAKRPRTPKRRR